MKPPIHFIWLTLAALADWLIARTLARAAIFMPKSPVVLQIYTAVGIGGQLATSLTSLLTLVTLGWIAWQSLQRRKSLALPASCLALIVVNLLALFIPSPGWLALSFQALFCAAIITLVMQAWRQPLPGSVKLSVSVTALALFLGRLYQSLETAYAVLRLPGPPAISGLLFNSGELVVLVSVGALWWAFGRQAHGRVWIVAGLPALVFAVSRLLAPAMTGIMAIWSTGLTMYLPWPAYVGALWLASVTVIYSLRHHQAAGWGLLLLAAGGFAPQMSTQAFLGMIGLWLLVNSHLPASVIIPLSRYSFYALLRGAADESLQHPGQVYPAPGGLFSAGHRLGGGDNLEPGNPEARRVGHKPGWAAADVGPANDPRSIGDWAG